MNLSKIFLYDEPTVPEIKIKKQAKFLEQFFNVEVECRNPITSNISTAMSKEIAECKIINLQNPYQKHIPTIYEITRIEKSSQNEIMGTFDGFELQQKISKLISDEELRIDLLHIVFTKFLTCTYDYEDSRYHGRALIGSNPAIISTTGIIEAPAKPRTYYFDIMTNMQKGLNLESIQKKYSGQYLKHHDKRLEDVIQGYLMQIVFYHITGMPFCKNKQCRLFNAHWQQDLIQSQVIDKKICLMHQQILQKFVNNLNSSQN